jgi:hypothetical protein
MAIRNLGQRDTQRDNKRYLPDRAMPRVAGVAALTVAVLLILGAVGLAVSSHPRGLRNWLVVLFQVNAGTGNLPSEPLRLINWLDVPILVLVAVTFLGLWPGLGRLHKVWMAIAVALPLLGIPALLLTHQAGRSGVMGGGIVAAVLMLTTRGLTSLGIIGLLANGLLLVGDFTTADSRTPIAFAVAIGYGLLVIWYAAIGVRLLASRPLS